MCPIKQAESSQLNQKKTKSSFCFLQVLFLFYFLMGIFMNISSICNKNVYNNKQHFNNVLLLYETLTASEDCSVSCTNLSKLIQTPGCVRFILKKLKAFKICNKFKIREISQLLFCFECCRRKDRLLAMIYWRKQFVV